MKVLLIFPPQKNPASMGPVELLLEEAGSFPPLGLLHLATAVAKQGKHQIRLIDSILDGLDFTQIEEIVRQEKPDVVGVPWNTEYLRDGYLTVKAVKKADPNVTVIVGGPHVFAYPKEVIEIPEVDIAVRGEADLIFPLILDNLESNQPLSGIIGVIEKNKAYSAYPLAVVDDPSALPIPDRRLLDYSRYASLIARGSPITTLMSSRGCCFNCPFCPAGGTKVRDRSVESVIAEIEDCISLGIKDILFFDEIFTLNKKRITLLCNEILKRKLKFRWHIRTRIQSVDEELLILMKKAGLVLIQFGIEAGTERVQKLLEKNIPLEKVREAVTAARKAGILVYGNFMLASPSESIDEIHETVRFARQLKLDFAIFSLTRYLPGTTFYKGAVNKGRINDFWQKYAADPMYQVPEAYCSDMLSKDDLKNVALGAYKEFYLRPAYVSNYLFRILRFSVLAGHLRAGFMFFAKLLQKNRAY